MKSCLDCKITDPISWHGNRCASCYKQRYYRNHLDKERETRKRDAKYYNRTPSGRYKRAVFTAKKREIDFHLTFDDYSTLVIKPCHYCSSAVNPTGVGLDRIDPNKGYAVSNVVPCCGACNVMRNRVLTFEEMVYVSGCLKEYRRSK